MVGTEYWTTGIKVHYVRGGWSAECSFFDGGFCQDDSTEGVLRTRYYVPTLAAAIDLLKRDAERLGIVFRSSIPGCPTLYVEGDGESADVSLPADWRPLLHAEALRLGRHSTYGIVEVNG